MNTLRSLLNAVILAVYLVRLILFTVARVCGSIPGGIVIFVAAFIAAKGSPNPPAAMIYVPFVFITLCRVSYPHLRVKSRPRLLQAPAAPPPSPPSASGITGRADDPNEATVIGRLDPKLRELLRRKPDASAS